MNESYIGQYVKVTQEVRLDDVWVGIEYGGWVAKQTLGGEVMFDNGETYSLSGPDTRATQISIIPTRSQPAWILHPDRWVRKVIKKGDDGREEGYWEPNLAPKVEGAECYRCSLLNAPIANSPTRSAIADVLHIAEAPGRNEINQQEFMVGRSGSMYRNLVSQILPSYTHTINNACMCYGETPDGQAIEACRKRLEREIREVGARVIVAVGAVALKAITGLEGITEHQGRLLTSFSPPIIPCFHPAAILRRPDLFPDLVNALLKVRLFLDGEELIDVQPESMKREVASSSSASSLLSQLSSYPRLYADLETSGWSPYKDNILCISMAGGDDSGVKLAVTFPWEVVRESGELKRLLEERTVGYYNGAFDCQFLRSAGIEAKIGDDVMLKQYTLDERPTAQSLKYVAKRYCNAPDWEAPLRQYLPSASTSYSVIPKKVLYEYASLDAGYTGSVDPLIDRMMSDDNKEVYSRILLPAANMLLDVSRIGLKVDTQRLEELRPELEKRIEDLREELIVLSGHDFNPGSTKQLRQVMHELFGYDGSTGRLILDEEFGGGEEFVNKLLDFRGARKLLGTYVVGLLDDIVDGRIHPNLRLNGTVTGRLSAGNPNMLGMPKEKGGIKKLFVADEDWLLMEADGSQMEIRVLGALANDRQMIADFASGVDFHGRARDRLYGRGTGKDAYTHQEILDAKTGVFGPIYGRGAPSMARLLKCEIREAQKYIDKLWEPYPVALAYLKSKEQEVHEEGELRSYYGRVRRWGLITEDNVKSVEHEARNFTVSSASTDTNLLVMLATYHTYSHDLLLPILPVHDSVLSRVRAEVDVKEYKRFCERTAQELLETDMPFEYEVEIGPSWGEMEKVC